MKIKINNEVSIVVADTYLYSIQIEGYPFKVMWSEEYAKEVAGDSAFVDKHNQQSPLLDGDTTKKIYKAIKAIKALVKCGEIVA